MNKTKAENQEPVPGAGPNIYWLIKEQKFRVCWTNENGKRRERWRPADTPLEQLIALRNRMQANASDARKVAGPKGSFPRDVVRFLRTRKHMPCYASDRSHMKPWVKLFRKGSRHVITHEKLAAAVSDMSMPSATMPKGYSPREIKQRIVILRTFFRFHDHAGHKGATPCDYVKWPHIPKGKRKGVADSVIDAVAKKLVMQEQCGRLRDAKTRARYLVRATTGKRPCQIDRTLPDDVNFTTRIWNVPDAKHAPGGPMWLNDEMFGAWELFRDADAWGANYDHGSFAKTLRRNGWPGGKGGTRPYNMRHQTLQTMDEMEIDPRAIQGAGNHTSFETTEQFYLQRAKLQGSKVAGEVIDGRFTKDVFQKRAPKDYDKKTKTA